MVLLQQNKTDVLPQRIALLKERLYSRHYQTDIERAKYYTRVYKRTENQPPCMRAALGLEETLRNMTIRIEDGERLIGSKSAKEWGGPMYLEASGRSVWSIMAILFYGKDKAVKDVFPNGALGVSAEFLKDAGKITEEEFRELTQEILPYWKENNTGVHKIARWEKVGIVPSLKRNMSMGEGLRTGNPDGSSSEVASDTITGTADSHGHVSVGIKKVLDMGFKGIARQAAEQLSKLSSNEKNFERRKDFLESVQVSAKAACIFAERYARLAEGLAEKATGERKADLLEIADRCHRVPAEPP